MANAIDSAGFSSITTEDWRNRVEKELKGKSYNDHLVWESLDGFKIESWQNQPPKNQCNLIPLSRAWHLMTMVTEQDAQTANKIALKSLMNGSEATWFTKSFQGAAEAVVRNGIDDSIASVFIAGNTIFDPYHTLLKSGSDSEVNLDQQIVFDGKRLRERGSTAIQEIAYLICQAIEWCSKHGFDRDVYFKTANGSGFLTEMAKIRALRWIWSSILNNEGVPKSNPRIIATNLTIGYSKNDEHTNILRATSVAMSAICGGAQYIMIEPWDIEWKSENDFSERITRNIQNLLKDESKMDVNLNPADGSYFTENLTTAIAEKTWELIQNIENKGGFSEFARSGNLKSEILDSRSRLIEAYSSESMTLLNVNKFNSSKHIEESKPNKSTYQLLPDFLHLPTEIKTL